jgi:hypothetical protein
MKRDVEPDDLAMTRSSTSGPAPVARRTLLQGLATTAAAVVLTGPATAGQAPATHHPPHPARTSAAEAPSGTESESGRFLDDHELATLTSLADQLVPGSARAGVPRLADRLLAVEPPDEQRRFRNALGAFEREARMRHARPWIELGASEQEAILNEASTAASSRWQPPTWTRGQPITTSPPSGPPPPATLRDHLDDLRKVVARIYYNTEPGLKELGWTGNVFWDGLPECGG